MDIDVNQRAQLVRLLSDVRERPYRAYPWEGLAAELRKTEVGALRLLAYGSLMNPESANSTLSKFKPGRPIISFGVRRVFDYKIPPDNSRYGPIRNAREAAALNVLATFEVDDLMNGVLLEIDPADVASVRAREVGYDLIPILCSFLDLSGLQPFVAWTLRCPKVSADGIRRTDTSLLPHRNYYRVCREAAAARGDEFLRFWLETTFLADGCTSVRTWESAAFPSGF